ncbi:hypothetical protein [Kangiella sp.]|uniref:hypothetical protein n=1 Tax=Kangiella sp. TaxID=1920245 RepID=UPI001989701D|nr:hypothetical protein [Kangiella sp.]MBD3652337.1 hypothetical protein [Kangiella sp.]
MEFLFIAPFRTDFNLNSLEAICHREAIVDVLLLAVQAENEIDSGFRWLVPWNKEEKGELHYSELNEDQVPDSATPLLKLHLQPKYVKQKLDEILAESEFKEYEINKCDVLYFDNTVGILTITLSFSDRYKHEDVFPVVDKWSTQLCSSIVKIIVPHEVSILKNIQSLSKERERNLFLSPRDFIVFFDRFENSMANTDKENERMLWVNRTYIGHVDNGLSPVLERWTQSRELRESALLLDESAISTCVGNSVVYGKLSEENKYAVETALQISTYFYVLYDVFNKILKLLYLEMSSSKKAKESTISRVNRIRAHIEFIENEFGDVLMGLQGKRSAIASRFMETWSYSELVDAVQKKKNSASRFAESILSERQNKYGRVVEAFLAAIGGVSLLDFILSLFAFSNDKNLNTDTVVGIVDGAKRLPVDGVLYAAIALLVFVLILVLRKR